MATNADIQRLLDYFGSSSSIYRKVVLGQATDSEIAYALSQVPRMQVDVSAAGSTLGYTYADPVYMTPAQPDDIQKILNSIDSNGSPSTLGGDSGGGVTGNFPISFGRDPVTGQAYIEAGKKGLGETLKAVADRVALGVTGVNIGAKLGKAIDQTLYNLNPAWWDEHLPGINPATWPTIAGTNSAGQSFIRTLFDIAPDGSTVSYVDERVFAQYYQMLMELGLWNSGEDKTVTVDDAIQATVDPNHYVTLPFEMITTTEIIMSRNNDMLLKFVSPDPVEVCKPSTGAWGRTFFVSSKNPIFFQRYISYDGGNTWTASGTYGDDRTSTFYNETAYYYEHLYSENESLITPIPTVETADNTVYYSPPLSWIMQYGDVTEGSGIDGFTDIEGATQYPPTNITGPTLNDTLSQMKQQYPDLFTNPITESVLQPDGTTQTITYIPVPWQITNPSDKTQTAPITQPNPQQSPQIDPTLAPDVVIDPNPNTLDDTETQTDTPPQTPNPNTPNTGDGDTPPVILPTGQASSLWAIYNPTQAQLNSFGGWLWSSNFVEQLKKLFNDPMQAIIGVHKVFAQPITGGERTIVCGYLDSGVSSKIVTSQYSSVDCGSVSMQEYFGNVFDYSPFTTVKIYLPFIGIVPLDVAYIMRSTISVEYKVDVLTGACLANVSVSRDGCGGVLFTYGGSAIVSYPISSGSYTGVVAGALSLATGIVGTVASGGAMLPATLGALSGLGRMRTEVQHSGQFSGSAGAMGSKIPYLIIERPQTRVANNIEFFNGIPSNEYNKIANCDNFVQVEKVHLIISNAYDYEIKEIEELLISGILINDNEITPPSPSGDIQPIQITANGTYNAPSNLLGYNPVIVNVENSYTQSDEGKVVVNGELINQTSITITENGIYDTTENNSITVNVSGDSGEEIDIYAFNFSPSTNANAARSAGLQISPLYDLQVIGIRFWARDTVCNVYISDINGNVIAEKQNAIVNSNQWNDVLFNTPIAIQRNTSYVIWGSNLTSPMRYEMTSLSSSFVTLESVKYSTTQNTFPTTAEAGNAKYGIDLIIALWNGIV